MSKWKGLEDAMKLGCILLARDFIVTALLPVIKINAFKVRNLIFFARSGWIAVHAVAVTFCTVALAGCGGGSDGGKTFMTDDPATVARLEWVTAAPLFTSMGQQHSLEVQALDETGKVLNVQVSWSSSAPAVVSVANGTSVSTILTTQSSSGTAMVTATVGTHSVSTVAIVTIPAAGTVVLTDTQVIGDPEINAGTLATGRLDVGSTYTVTLQSDVPAPTVGSLVLGQGSKAIAGEVTSVNGQILTLAMVPLQRLLPQLNIDLDLPLQAGPARSLADLTDRKQALAVGGAHESAETSFRAAGFECDVQGSARGVELAKKDIQLLGQDTLRYRVLWNSQRKMLRLSGQPGVQFEIQPQFNIIALSGNIDCKLELAHLPIPLPPVLGLFLGSGFPIGIGFKLEGDTPTAGLALNLKGQARADVVVGFDCTTNCILLNSIKHTGSVTPTLKVSEFPLGRVDLKSQVYAWANFEGGSRWSQAMYFRVIEAEAGLEFSTTLATDNLQAKDDASAAQYELKVATSVAPTEALGDFAGLLDLVLDKTALDSSFPIARSPTATITADRTSFKSGENVNFVIKLNSDEVLFPVLGYNVQSVRVYRKIRSVDGDYTLELVGEQLAKIGQIDFSIPWVATVDSIENISFVGFVQTNILSDLRWRIGALNVNSPAVDGTLSVGYYSSCAVTNAGAAKCWGKNAYGELGNGTNIDSSVPVEVAGLVGGIKAVGSAGGYHHCALTQAGGVKCWGLNSAGELGNGSNSDSSVPVDVVGLSSGVVEIGVGGGSACALTIAGAVKCWGANDSGQLGNGAVVLSSSNTPVDVAGLTSGVVSIRVGLVHACALTSVGSVKCWGSNVAGELGRPGSFTGKSTIPLDIFGLSEKWVAISAGIYSTCALGSKGLVRCLGYNAGGQPVVFNSTPVDVLGLGGDVVSISVGLGDGCALTGKGVVKCWGSSLGARGNVNISSSAPVDIAGLGDNVTAVSVGYQSACAKIRGGAIKCWGSNAYGLGDGSTTDSWVPIAIVGFP